MEPCPFFSRNFGHFFRVPSHGLIERPAGRVACQGAKPVNESSLPEESIFAQALELASAAERAAYLDRACGANRQLRAEVEALLRAHEESGDLLDLPERAVATVDEAITERPGMVIGPYKLLEQIGEG